jgi:hypothetical protein
MKEEESTHTHHTNEILLGASVSDHFDPLSTPGIPDRGKVRDGIASVGISLCLCTETLL